MATNISNAELFLRTELESKNKMIKKLLKIAFPCEHCGGTGVMDDAEPGDISYNEWLCSLCDGFNVRSAKIDLLHEMGR